MSPVLTQSFSRPNDFSPKIVPEVNSLGGIRALVLILMCTVNPPPQPDAVIAGKYKFISALCCCVRDDSFVYQIFQLYILFCPIFSRLSFDHAVMIWCEYLLRFSIGQGSIQSLQRNMQAVVFPRTLLRNGIGLSCVCRWIIACIDSLW